MSSATVGAVSKQVGSVWTNRRGRPGRLGLLFAGVWLVFLVDPLGVGWSHRDTVRGWVGILAVLCFAAVYLVSFALVRQRRLRNDPRSTPGQAVLFLGAMALLGLVACLALGQSGTASLVYLAVASVMWLPGPLALAVVTLVAVVADLSARLVPGWGNDSSLTFAVCTAAFAMWGVNQLMLRNLDLMRAHDENARLAVADERNRFARDLHDILGHSLTVITVKAELANRLLDVDPERARSEIGDLERLSRDALSDVRRAVEGYHDLTLPGEIARAREALLAADIDADLPKTTDEVPSELRELFAWTVREGVTNVIRHSGATRCTVRLTPTEVEVRDDGAGPEAGRVSEGGHGLAGLRQRASAVGAVLVTRQVEPTGFALSVLAP
jgi:two-component system, NarL family, sensor histidine kinase DesK